MRGYAAFEGIDGAGKSTVCRLVGESLEERGVAVVTVREPGGTAAGEAIRQILLHGEDHLADWTEALLFAAARAQLAATTVGPALAAGKVVLSDRSVYSSLAYQGGGRRLGLEAVRAVNRAGLEEVWPDTVVLLRIEASTGLGREDGMDRISGQGVGFQRRVAEAYDALAAAEPDRFIVVEAERPLEEIVAQVVARLEERW